MKKLISLILAVLMAGLCVCGIAEETDKSAGTAFLRIKEGVTAQVFENPGDEQAIDTLASGRICGQLGEEVTEAGATWFQVFYLSSRKTGATGYINAEDAERLTENQLKALMEDPETLNEILDLIDAINAYLSKKDVNTENGGKAQENEVKSLYEQAMDGLKKLFGTSLSSELGNLEKEGKELANKARKAGEALYNDVKEAGGDLLDKAKEAGGDLLDKAKEAGEKLKDSVTDALDSVDGEDIGEKIGNLKDNISDTVEGWIGNPGEKIDEAMQKVSDAMKKLDSFLGGSTGDSLDGFSKFVEKTNDWLNGADFSKVNDAVNDLSEAFKEDGFSGGVGSIIDNLKTIFSPK